MLSACMIMSMASVGFASNIDNGEVESNNRIHTIDNLKYNARDAIIGNGISPYSTTVPTSFAPTHPYSGNWDGTTNYSYTKYYFDCYGMKSSATTPYDVAFYYKDSSTGKLVYGGTGTAEIYNGSKYEYNLTVGQNYFDYYYFKFVNTGSSSASGTFYTEVD